MLLKKKLEIQNIAEKILRKHDIDPSEDSYYLKLSMPNFDDLVIKKEGEQVLIGHYYHPSGILFSDPVLVFDYNEGYWFPIRIEQILRDTVCSFLRNGKRLIIPENIKDFRLYQRIFARNIREHGWLKDGVKVV